jgi:hypothetical protein
MKKLLTKILAISSIGLLLLPSCKKDENRAVATIGKTGTLAATSTAPALSKDKADDVAVTFSWPATTVTGYAAKVSYTLQIDIKGNDFKSTKLVEVPLTSTTQTYKVQDFNALLLGMGLPFTGASDVEVRVKAGLAANAVTYTNVLTLSVTPYPLVSFIYLAGQYQSTDGGKQWKPETGDSLKSATSNGIYTGIINFKTGTGLEFKANPAKNWDHSYGSSDGSATVTYDGGDNLKAPAFGLYTITLDLNTKKLTFTPVANYYSVIGAGSPTADWGIDADMKFNNGTGVWDITGTFTGEFKVRKNHDWTISYGTPKTGADGSTLASSDDDNLKVTASGTYYFTFSPISDDDKTAKYTLVKK